MLRQRFHKLILIVALASMLISGLTAASPNQAEAGSNGQQLQIYYNISNSDCPVRVTVVGYNQNGVYSTWSDRGLSSCDTWYIRTSGYWWKGRVWVQATYRRPNGTMYNVGYGYYVPTSQPSDFFRICLPGARNCGG